jgi:hypothetical protein
MATTPDESRPTLTLKKGTSWTDAWQRCLAVAPEAFRDDRVLNLWGAEWRADGRPLPATSPVDAGPVAGHRPAGRTRLARPAPCLAPRPPRRTPGPRGGDPRRADPAP